MLNRKDYTTLISLLKSLKASEAIDWNEEYESMVDKLANCKIELIKKDNQ